VEILHNFVAFSEYMNFKKPYFEAIQSEAGMHAKKKDFFVCFVLPVGTIFI
jgi:hypothetical protein